MRLIGGLFMILLVYLSVDEPSIINYFVAWAIIATGVWIGGTAVGMGGFVRTMNSVAPAEGQEIDLDEAADVVVARVNLWLYLGVFVGGCLAALLVSVIV